MSRLPASTRFRRLRKAHFAAVLRDIAANDPNEAEVLERVLQRPGTNAYVLERDGKVIGVTGFRLAGAAYCTYWLSWTYVDPLERFKYILVGLVEEVIDILREEGARKLFATTRDRSGSPKPGPYTLDAAVFRELGFQQELRQEDYFAPGEAMVAYGLRIQAPDEPEPKVSEDHHLVEILDWHELEECEGAWFVDWAYVDGAYDALPEIEEAVAEARLAGARVVFLCAGSDAVAARAVFESAGFRFCGRYQDFYEDGLHEDQFRLDL